MERLATFSLTGQDISSPLLVATYTADATRELLVNLCASGLAGGGDYRAYLTKQRLGTGTVFKAATSTVALDASTDALYLPSISVPVIDDDVIRVYFQGLAGDVGVAITTDVFDVSTDVATVLARIGAFTGTGVNTVLGFLKALASKVASLPSDFGGTFSPALHSLEALRERMADVVDEEETGTNYTRKRGDTWTIGFTLGNISGHSKVWFALKRRTSDADANAILFVEKTAGLTIVNGAAYTTPTDATITITDAETGAGYVTVLPAVTKLIEPRADLDYDVQALVGAVVSTPQSGILTVTGDVVRAVS